MHKHLLYGFIVCFISISLAGCIVGYKSFSADEMQSVPPAPSLENIKLTCTSDDKPRICDSIQYILRTKYHILDVQTIGTNEKDRARIRVNYSNEKSNISGAWSVISGLTFAVIPAVLSEDHVYRFTITTPAGGTKEYDYRFTERTYSWLPLLVFNMFVPGYYEDPTGLSMDAYARKRRAILEEGIIPRFVNDATPFLLSAGPSQEAQFAKKTLTGHKYAYTIKSRYDRTAAMRHMHPADDVERLSVVQRAMHDSFFFQGISDVIKSDKFQTDRINIVVYAGNEPDQDEIHIINPALEHARQLKIIKTTSRADSPPSDKTPDEGYYQSLRIDDFGKEQKSDYLRWRRTLDRVIAETERN